MLRLPVVILNLILVAATAWLGGCQGQYTFTIPEQVAPAGGKAIVVARLQKSEFASISPPAKNICMRFTVEDGPLSAAYTDKRGYAAAGVQVPPTPGRYHVVAAIMDKDGREAIAFSPVYVLDGRSSCVAVDLACLDGLGKNESALAKVALSAIAQRAYIIYFTASTADQAHRHERLKAAGFPDGAILQWQRQFWHAVKHGTITRVVVEDRMVSQLPILRQMLPNLKIGITNSMLAAQAFAKADMKCVDVAQASVFEMFQKKPANTRRMNWQQLAQMWQTGDKTPATQPATEPTTEPTTEPATESTTQPVSQSTTEPATQMAPESEMSASQPATELATQPATESAATEPTTQSATQPATESAATEPQTAPATPATQPASEPAAQMDTQPTTQPATDTTQPSEMQ